MDVIGAHVTGSSIGLRHFAYTKAGTPKIVMYNRLLSTGAEKLLVSKICTRMKLYRNERETMLKRCGDNLATYR
jgi:hypothetical protein